MPRGRRKVRGGLVLTLQSDRGASSDSFGAPRTKETRLDSEDSDSPYLNPSQLLVSSPNRSLRDKITDFFGYNQEDFARSRSISPEMPVLMPQVSISNPMDSMPDKVDSPPQLSDDGSEQSCGNSDSGKENDEEGWRGRPRADSSKSSRSRPRSDSNKMKMPLQQQSLQMPLQQQQQQAQSQPVAAGRVTRSASGKVPLSLKGCENLQNELNIADGSLRAEYKEKDSSNEFKAQISPTATASCPSMNPSPQSPPTPHKIIRVKETSLSNPLSKLKSISLTPKKSTKSAKQTKRQGGNTSAAPLVTGTPTNTNTKAGKLQQAANTSHKVTEYFPIRRSERKPKAELIKAELETICSYLAQSDDSKHGTIEVAPIENKGRGIKAVKDFNKGDFVVEYAGDLIDIGTAKDLETKYSMDASKGCYMYYFKHKGKQYCIDATSESGRYGRLVNHSRVSPNCVTKVIMMEDIPRLILVAKHHIEAGTELLYDYGDRSKESLKAHPWLAL